MPQSLDPLYQNPKTHVWYARWYDGSRRVMLSLDTTDKATAMKREPFVRKLKVSWTKCETIMNSFDGVTVHSVNEKLITPGEEMTYSKMGMLRMFIEGLETGKVVWNPESGRMRVLAQPAVAIKGDTAGTLQRIEQQYFPPGIAKQGDHWDQIEKFYTADMIDLYDDKDTASRFGRIWLKFLKEKAITDWSKINEPLLKEFRLWRKSTSIPQTKTVERTVTTDGKRHKQKRTIITKRGVLPSITTVNRQIRFLQKSFDIAISKDFILRNPIVHWEPEKKSADDVRAELMATDCRYLTIPELREALSDPRLDQDYVTIGSKGGLDKTRGGSGYEPNRLPLGYCLRDVLLLLFTSCKRRKEILSLRIEDVFFDLNAIAYEEWKNQSKGAGYGFTKAFHITEEMKVLLRRIMGNRTNGDLFPSPSGQKHAKSTYRPHRHKNPRKTTYTWLNPDFVSGVWTTIIREKFPEKDCPLKNLRQTATEIMDDAGVSNENVNNALGHFNAFKIMRHYRSDERARVARRIGPITKPGIQALSDVVKDLLVGTRSKPAT